MCGNSILTELNHFFYSFFTFGLTSIVTLHKEIPNGKRKLLTIFFARAIIRKNIKQSNNHAVKMKKTEVIELFIRQFVCSNEEATRSLFKRMQEKDAPLGKGLFGGIYGQGIHFQACDDMQIKGFFLNVRENITRRRGGIVRDPWRLYFRGKFVQKGEQTVFSVYTYPQLFWVLLFGILCLVLIVLSPLRGSILSALVLFIFLANWVVQSKKLFKRFSKLIR